ncbi:MAG: MOSC domain-containing protein [Bacteroidales bacterium]|nr:MOSC domain-containing protein [Bacteroidales bacterium]
MGALKGIGYKLKKYEAVVTCDEAFVGLLTGVARDVRGLPGKRQVTVLSEEAFNEACNELGTTLPWTIRRANLLISGIDLENSKGKNLAIGSVVLEVTGETDPCYRMDEQFEGLKDALEPNWRGGVTCSVMSEGYVKLGDEVKWV